MADAPSQEKEPAKAGEPSPPKTETTPPASPPSQPKVKPASPPSKPEMKAAAPASPPSKPQMKAAPPSQPKMPAASASAPGGATADKSPASKPQVKAAAPASQPKMAAGPPASRPQIKTAIPTAEIVETPSRSRLPGAAARIDTSESRVRRRGDAVPPRKGLGLQLKIMLAMGLTSLLGAAGIAVAVHTRASAAFEEQINERGERLVDILAAVPADYWLFAIHGLNRESDFVEVLKAVEPIDDFGQKPEFTRLRNVLADPFSSEWQA